MGCNLNNLRRNSLGVRNSIFSKKILFNILIAINLLYKIALNNILARCGNVLLVFIVLQRKCQLRNQGGNAQNFLGKFVRCFATFR